MTIWSISLSENHKKSWVRIKTEYTPNESRLHGKLNHNRKQSEVHINLTLSVTITPKEIFLSIFSADIQLPNFIKMHEVVRDEMWMNTTFLLPTHFRQRMHKINNMINYADVPHHTLQNTEWSTISSAPCKTCTGILSYSWLATPKIIRSNTYKHETRIVLISPAEWWKCPLMNVFSVYTMAPMMCVTRYNKTRFQDIHQLQITSVTEHENRNW